MSNIQGRPERGAGGVKVPGPGLLGGPDSSDEVKGPSDKKLMAP